MRSIFIDTQLLWAPHVDKYGTKKHWLLLTLLLMALTSGLTSLVEFTDVSTFAAMLFLQNICASVQDISVDALAIGILSVEDVGLGNVAQVVGYKFGGLTAGEI